LSAVHVCVCVCVCDLSVTYVYIWWRSSTKIDLNRPRWSYDVDETLSRGSKIAADEGLLCEIDSRLDYCTLSRRTLDPGAPVLFDLLPRIIGAPTYCRSFGGVLRAYTLWPAQRAHVRTAAYSSVCIFYFLFLVIIIISFVLV
jgi:hypothetical protein